MDLQLEDLKRIKNIFAQINTFSNNLSWANAITDELFMYQPFLLSMLMGYQYDLAASELDETVHCYIGIWQFFKHNDKVRKFAVTQARFEEIQQSNLAIFLNNDPAERDDVTIILAVIMERFKIRPVLANMELKTKGAVIIGLKSMIECFEEISA